MNEIEKPYIGRIIILYNTPSRARCRYLSINQSTILVTIHLMSHLLVIILLSQSIGADRYDLTRQQP